MLKCIKKLFNENHILLIIVVVTDKNRKNMTYKHCKAFYITCETFN